MQYFHNQRSKLQNKHHDSSGTSVHDVEYREAALRPLATTELDTSEVKLCPWYVLKLMSCSSPRYKLRTCRASVGTVGDIITSTHTKNLIVA